MKQKRKVSKYFNSLKIIEFGQVEKCIGQVSHEVYLADG